MSTRLACVLYIALSLSWMTALPTRAAASREDGIYDSTRLRDACGNGILEPGEECDDGNVESGDGCSATCLLEAVVWHVDIDDCVAPGSGTSDDPFCKIDEGIAAAQPGDTVRVADGTYEAPQSGLSFGGKAITVRSENGPARCIIDGQSGGRVVTFSNNETESSVLDGFTITNGNSGEDGGGVFCADSSPTISNCIITANYTWRRGGGVACEGGAPTFTRCRIVGNTADPGFMFGGGVFCEDSEAVFHQCVIARNMALWGEGIVCGGGVPTFKGCFITEHFTGLSVRDGNPNVTHCTITGHAHGVVVGDNASATITGCIIWDNDNTAIFEGEGSLTDVTYSCVEGGYTGVWNIADDPMLLPGGLQLAPSSPCVNAGDPGMIVGADETDLAGRPRLRCGRIDIGAMEGGFGDSNCDQTADLADFADARLCMNGPAGDSMLAAVCLDFDVDLDGDVDLIDLAQFQRVFDR